VSRHHPTRPITRVNVGRATATRPPPVSASAAAVGAIGLPNPITQPTRRTVHDTKRVDMLQRRDVQWRQDGEHMEAQEAAVTEPTQPTYPGARLTLAQAAQLTGHAAVSLRQAVRLGRLTAEQVGEGRRATYYVTEADLESYLQSRRSWHGYHGKQPSKENDA
jgi:hypothetical protein